MIFNLAPYLAQRIVDRAALWPAVVKRVASKVVGPCTCPKMVAVASARQVESAFERLLEPVILFRESESESEIGPVRRVGAKSGNLGPLSKSQ